MAFVVSRGQLAGTDTATPPRQPTSMRLDDRRVAEYAHLWKSQPEIRTVVTFLARNIAMLPLQVFDRVGDSDRRRVPPTDPLVRLLAQPQPRKGPVQFLNSVMHDLGIYDRAYRIKVKGDGRTPAALLRGNPRRMSVVGGTPWEPGAYRLVGNRGFHDFAPDEVVHWHGFDPDDDRDGCSPIEALRRTLVGEFYAADFREKLYRNGARVSGYLKRPQGAPDWYKVPREGGESARDRFRRDWQAQYTGEGPQVGGTPVLEDGMEFVPASITPEEAQSLEHRKLSREECAAAYFIPPPMIGILDHATFSNIEEQHKHVYMDTLGLWIALLEEGLDLQLVPDFGVPNRYVELNLAAKLAGSFEERAGVLQQAVGGPWLTRNEARAMDNRSPVPGGDELIVPLNVVAGGQASPQDSAPPPKALAGTVLVKARAPRALVERTAKVMRATFDRQARSVAGALKARPDVGAKASVEDVFDPARWDAELAADLYVLNEAISSAATAKAAAGLGWDLDEFDVDRTLAFLQANAERVAGGVNGATAKALAEALAADNPADAVADVFARAKDHRAEAIARAQVSSISGFGTTEVARQRVELDEDATATKTWRTTSPRPRATHAALDGVSVPIDSPFPNGADWPGDPQLPDGERAGCTCDVEVSVS